MPKRRQGELSQQQEACIGLLLAGVSDIDCAEKIGVARQTVWAWRSNDLAFRDELARRRANLWGQAIDHLRALLPLAVDVLESELREGLPGAKRIAALHVLKACGLYGNDHSPISPTSEDKYRLDPER